MSRRRLAAVPENPQRVVLYVRVSALMGRGGEDFYSPDLQIGAMRRVTAGMKVVEVIDDDIDQTGRTFDRDGIARIKQLAEAGAIDAMAVYNLSRFGRNVLEGLQFLSWLADHGVTILSATEHVDTSTPSGRWMLTNMLAVAEMRSDEIGQEWARVHSARAKAGKPHGRPPTGYIKNDSGRLIPHPVHGPAITKAFSDWADGKSGRFIRQQLRAITGLQMPTITLRGILRNRAYLGEVRVGDVVTKDAHPPLTDAQTWERVAARMRKSARTPSRLAEPKYPLSGLARCGHCGGSANHRHHGSKVRMFCRSKFDVQSGCIGFGWPDVLLIENAVLAEVETWVAELRSDSSAAAAVRSKAARSAIDAQTVREELRQVRKALARAAEGWSLGRMDDQTYDTTRGSLERQRDELQEVLDGLKVVASAPGPAVRAALAERLLTLWPRMSAPQRNRALRELIDYVAIYRAPRWSADTARDFVHVEWR